jgi:hypothetical protein
MSLKNQGQAQTDSVAVEWIPAPAYAGACLRRAGMTEPICKLAALAELKKFLLAQAFNGAL